MGLDIYLNYILYLVKIIFVSYFDLYYDYIEFNIYYF